MLVFCSFPDACFRIARGHSCGPRVAAGLARGSTVRGPACAGGSSFLACCFRVGGLVEAGCEYLDAWGFAVMVALVAVACGNFGRAFCARGECRWRPGMFRVCRAARAAASAAAASASSDDVAVTWVDVMERIAW